MEFLGIGPSELLLILVIMLVVLGPEDMVKMAKQASQMIRKVISSPVWKSMMSTSQELRELPTKLVRESGLEEDLKEIRKSTKSMVEPLEKELKQPILEKEIKLDPPSSKNGKKNTGKTQIPNKEPLPETTPEPSETANDDSKLQTDGPIDTPTDENISGQVEQSPADLTEAPNEITNVEQPEASIEVDQEA